MLHSLSIGLQRCGPGVWQTCLSRFRDDGAFCAKPKPYGRGIGYPWKFGDKLNDHGMRSRYEKAHPEGCEKNGLIYYPKCREGSHNVGLLSLLSQLPIRSDGH